MTLLRRKIAKKKKNPTIAVKAAICRIIRIRMCQLSILAAASKVVRCQVPKMRNKIVAERAKVKSVFWALYIPDL